MKKHWVSKDGHNFVYDYVALSLILRKVGRLVTYFANNDIIKNVVLINEEHWVFKDELNFMYDYVTSSQ